MNALLTRSGILEHHLNFAASIRFISKLLKFKYSFLKGLTIETLSRSFYIDYLLFAEMLLQRPVGNQKLDLSNLNQLSENDVKYMQEMAGQRFDMIMSNLRSMPRTMLLTIR